MLVPSLIDEFNFEVTRRCNGKCFYCNIWKEHIEDGSEISPQDLRRGLRPYRLFRKVRVIVITGGEPILRTDLLEVIRELHEICPGARFVLDTNGLLPERFLKTVQEVSKVLKSPVDVTISLDGFPYTDQIQRGDPKHSELAWKTYNLLKENGIAAGFNSTLTKLNIGEMAAFRENLLNLGINHAFAIAATSEHYYLNEDNKSFVPIDGSDVETVENLASIGASTSFNYYLPRYLKKPRQIFPCFSGFTSFFLDSKGTVYPCIHLNKSLGSLLENSFGRLWYSDRAKEIRRGIISEKCHCWTACEANNTIKNLVYPAVLRRLRH
jgi:radical SAM protein with 4Fe4S-binding SPASM domain